MKYIDCCDKKHEGEEVITFYTGGNELAHKFRKAAEKELNNKVPMENIYGLSPCCYDTLKLKMFAWIIIIKMKECKYYN